MAQIGLGPRIGQHIVMYEAHIARCAYQDPDWVEEPPPSRYDKGKSPAGEKIAEKIRDLRLRRSLTGTMGIQRLTKKTNPKEVQHIEEIDFEAPVAAYKDDIKHDIRAYTRGSCS